MLPTIDRTSVQRGPGPHIVFVHGLEDTSVCWEPIISHLPATMSISTLEMPWRAGTRYEWRGTCSSEWLRQALTLVTEPIDVVVAHSFGGHAALEMCCSPTSFTSDIVLICPLYWSRHFMPTWTAFDAARKEFERHIEAGLLTRLGPRRQLLPSAIVDGMISRALDRVGPLSLMTVFDRMVSSRALPVENIHSRVLILAAEGDPTLPPKAAAHLSAAIKDCELVMRPEFDHFCNIHHAQELAARIAEFATGETRTSPQPGPTSCPGEDHVTAQ